MPHAIESCTRQATIKAKRTDVEKITMLVLETDEPHPETVARGGTFGEMFDKLFTTAGDEHDPPLGVETIMTYVVEDDGGQVPLPDDIGDVHAILITGSMYDAHGDEAWIMKLINLIQRLWTQRPDIKLSGVCFGHQIICRALGSTVKPAPGRKWELAHTKVDLTQVGQRLFRVDETEIHLHQMHQDQVISRPSTQTTDLLGVNDKVCVWGSTDHTPVQGVYIHERLFTSQGHLGFDGQTVERQLQDRVESGCIECEREAEKAKMTAHMQHDGLVVASAILRFFHGDDRNVQKT